MWPPPPHQSVYYSELSISLLGFPFTTNNQINNLYSSVFLDYKCLFWLYTPLERSLYKTFNISSNSKNRPNTSKP